jgi:hypothetical protein
VSIACDRGIGAVLSQQGHHIAFLSKALSIANQRLSIYDKESLTVLMAVDKWRPYLLKQPFIIMTYPVFMPRSSTHRMYNPGSTVPHIRTKSVHR